MAVRLGRAVGAAVVLAVVLGGLTACNGASQVVSCGKEAIRIASDVQDVEGAVTNVGQFTDAAHRQQTTDALKKLRDDAGKIHVGSSDAKAADDLSKAVQNAQQAVADGKKPDLGPIVSSAGVLTKSCGNA